jgi:shikimate dehydrogenase
MDNSAAKIFAVIGKPVLHSKSPDIFNAAFASMGINARYIRLRAESAEDAVATFRKIGMAGANITAPFKEDIMPYLDYIDQQAIIIGGVNTVVNNEGKLYGYNTDHYGVADSVSAAGLDIKKMRCVVIGAGGAGKAAAYGLHINGADVVIANRTLAKAEAAALAIGCRACSLEDLQQEMLNAELIVSSLSAEVNPIEYSWLKTSHIIFDANYSKSALGTAAAEKECRIIGGLDWLLNQAVPSFRHFFCLEPDKEAMQKGLAANKLESMSSIIAMIGFMGAGKTTVGKKVSKLLRRGFSDTDSMIEKIEGRCIPDIFSAEGEQYFRQIETSELQTALSSRARLVVSTGGGVPTIDRNRKMLSSSALSVWLYASPERVAKRITQGRRPLLDVENPEEKAAQLLKSRLFDYAQTADIMINTDTIKETEIANILYEEISKAFGN